MQTKLEKLSDLKFNRETWRRELRFHYEEMAMFQNKLEEIARTEFGQDACKKLEIFQNRIMIEQSVIAKLKHRCKELVQRNEQTLLRDDMRTYIKLHYDLKEEMMDFLTEYLQE